MTNKKHKSLRREGELIFSPPKMGCNPRRPLKFALQRYEFQVEGISSSGFSHSNVYVCYNMKQASELASLDGLDTINAVESLGETKEQLDSRLLSPLKSYSSRGSEES
jgi:hypothetical protein